jgi:hypothetical protein
MKVRRRRADGTVSPVAMVRQLRRDLAAERDITDQLRKQLTGLIDATAVDSGAYWRQLCREIGDQREAEGQALGYVRAIEDVKAAQHGLVDAVRLGGRRLAPRGAAWLAAVERCGGTEYGGQGRPRVPVPAELLAAARETGR